MRRRRLLVDGTLAGAAMMTISPSGAASSEAPPPASPATTAAFELEELTVADLRRGIDEGRWTAARLVELYLARIDAVDRQGPALRSIIEVNPDGPRIAAELDAVPPKKRGPLHGIPVLVKDNIDTGDSMKTSAGSLAMAGPPAPRDAAVVARLRAAGAVILGKTNLSEWANIRSTRSTSGWSARGGQTRSPYVLDRCPCGSSSGSGAAIAANLAAFALGTETDGSIVCPASTNGLVGIKPTVGLVSRAGVVPIAHSQDTVGPMARTVADAALALGIIAGADPRDPATQHPKAATVLAGDPTLLNPRGLAGIRLGVVRQHAGFNPDVDRVFAEALAALTKAGAFLVDPVEVPHPPELDAAELEVLLYELKADLAAYLATRPDLPVKSLADVMAFNVANREREMPHFGQELFERAQAKGSLDDASYRTALETCQRLSRAEGIDAALKSHQLDALVAPTNGPAWVIDVINGDHVTGGYASGAAIAGYPHVTVPAGQVRGLPVGISIFGSAWSEPALVRFAYAFEQATKARKPPRFLPTL